MYENQNELVIEQDRHNDDLEFALETISRLPVGHYFIFGSNGRALAIASSKGEKPVFRKSPDLGIYDFDVAIEEGAMSWEQIRELSEEVYERTSGRIDIDPHLYKVEGSDLVFTRSRPAEHLPTKWFKTVECEYHGINVHPIDVPGQALFMAIWRRFRQKDISEYLKLFSIIREKKEFLEDERTAYVAGVIKEYLSTDPKGLAYDLGRMIYHVSIPQRIREKLSLRNKLAIKDEVNDTVKFGHMSLTPIYI